MWPSRYIDWSILFSFAMLCRNKHHDSEKTVEGGDEYSSFWDLTRHRVVFDDMAEVLTASMFSVVEECQSTRRRITAECNLHWLYRSENVKNSRGRDVHIHERSEISNAYYTTGCSNTRASEN